MNKDNLRVKIFEDDHADGAGKSKGFINHRIDLFQDEKRVGFIKLTLLTSDGYKKLCPTIWHYMRLWGGWVGLNPDGPKEEIMKTVAGHMGIWEGNFNALTQEEKEQVLEKAEIKCRPKEEKTLEFFLDKMFVCYIEVDQEHRNQGLGKRLYAEAYKFCKERGHDLYSDGTQTKDAKNVWESMVKAGVAENLGKRYRIISD